MPHFLEDFMNKACKLLENLSNGIFAGVKILTTSEILEIQKLSGLNKEFLEEEKDLHITTMYSKSVVSKEPSLEPSLVSVKTTFITGIESWKGHDDKSYLVLKVDPKNLQILRSRWITMGYIPTFGDYNPHITIAKGYDKEVPNIKAIEDYLLGKRIEVIFDNEYFEPLED